MEKAEEWADQLGAAKIELSVYFFSEKAIRFYEALGYEGIFQKMEKRL